MCFWVCATGPSNYSVINILPCLVLRVATMGRPSCSLFWFLWLKEKKTFNQWIDCGVSVMYISWLNEVWKLENAKRKLWNNTSAWAKQRHACLRCVHRFQKQGEKKNPTHAWHAWKEIYSPKCLFPTAKASVRAALVTGLGMLYVHLVP